uniref:Ribosomal protein L16 n=1 Tax=Pterocladiophila hemisphaerica TaxID=2712948 RepID=A0A6M3WWP7_9FLOR|nr:ribosomal protein L16 [Pterocladiophila hemisphaerica]
MVLKLKKIHNSYSLKKRESHHILKFGLFGFKILSFLSLSQLQVNTLEKLIKFKLNKIIPNKQKVKIWNLIKLNKTMTKLNSESRMGKGKGLIMDKSTFLCPFYIIFEFDNITKKHLIETFNYIKNQISFPIFIVKRYY